MRSPTALPLIVALGCLTALTQCTLAVDLDGLTQASDGGGGGGATTTASSSATGGAGGNQMGGGPPFAASWAQHFGGPGADTLRGMAVGANDQIAITGSWRDLIDFDGALFANAGDEDGFLVELGGDGNVLSSMTFGGPGQQAGNRVAYDVYGDLIVIGEFNDTFNFDGTPVTKAGDSEMFVAKVASIMHPGFIVRSFSTRTRANDFALDDQGFCYVVGSASGNLALGGVSVPGAMGDDALIFQVSPDGAVSNPIRSGDDENQSIVAIALVGQDVFIAGAFSGRLTLSPFVLQSGDTTPEMFVAKLDTSFAVVDWAIPFNSDGAHRIHFLEPDGAGGVVVGGAFSGSLDFTGGMLAGSGSDDDDAFVIGISGGGSVTSYRAHGGAGHQRAKAMALARMGVPYFGFDFQAESDFGFGPVTSRGENDAIMVSLTMDGSPRSQFHWGDSANQTIRTVATDSSNAVLIGGRNHGELDFGTGAPLMGEMAGDIYLVKHTP